MQWTLLGVFFQCATCKAARLQGERSSPTHHFDRVRTAKNMSVCVARLTARSFRGDRLLLEAFGEDGHKHAAAAINFSIYE